MIPLTILLLVFSSNYKSTLGLTVVVDDVDDGLAVVVVHVVADVVDVCL